MSSLMRKNFRCHATSNEISFFFPDAIYVLHRRWLFPTSRIAMGSAPAISPYSYTPFAVNEVLLRK
jgi:hypothetical protein